MSAKYKKLSDNENIWFACKKFTTRQKDDLSVHQFMSKVIYKVLVDESFHFLIQDKYQGLIHCFEFDLSTVLVRLLNGIEMNSLDYYE